MLKRITLFALIGLFIAAQAIANVTNEVKKSVDEVVKIVSNKEMKKNEHKRRQALKQAISVIFDYSEMAKRSLGRHWNQRTSAERKHFIDLYATLLENSYADKIESYHNERIVYVSESMDGDFSEVRSNIITAKHDEFSLNYRLIKENGKWMVYDVVIEGVSLVSNYRSQFNRVISQHGYGELLKKLETKSEELRTL
jgi:phospholipid transport system substrate-binding protein